MQSFDEREKIVNYGLIHIIDNNKPIRKIFNKANYSKEFHALYDLYTQALTAYNYLYEVSSEPVIFARETALKIIAHERNRLENIESKTKRSRQEIDDSIYTALFVIPVIDHFCSDSTNQLADFLVEEWRETFPKNQIQRGDFKMINEGFKERRGILDFFRLRS